MDLENATSAEEPPESDLATSVLHAGLLLDKVYTPLLCLFGALGNSLSLAVFCLDAKYRRQSSSYYLSALAVSDTGFLLNLFAVWLEMVWGGVITSPLMCPLVMYLGQVTCFVSVYLLVTFSIERYVAVHYPFSRPRLCTRSKAKKLICGITLVALLLFSYAWIIAQVIEIPGMGGGGPEVANNATPATLLDSSQVGEEEQEMLSFFIKRPVEQQLEPHWIGSHSSFHVIRKRQNGNGGSGGSKKNADVVRPGSVRREHMMMILHNKWDYFHIDYDDPDQDRRKVNNRSSTHHQNNKDDNVQPWNDTPFPTAATTQNEGGERSESRLLCTVPQEYYKISEVANYLDAAFTLIIPFLLITYFNVRIALSVWALKDQRQHILASPPIRKSSGGTAASLLVTANRQGSSINTTLLHPHYQATDGGTCNSRRTSSTSCLEDTESWYDAHSRRESRSSTREERMPLNNSGSESHGENHLSPEGKRIGECGGSGVKRDGSVVKRGSTQQLSSYPPPNQPQHQSSSEVRVTKMLLLVSTVFLVLNLPLHAIRCTQFIQSVTGRKEWMDILQSLQPWANLLFNTNFAVNFLLYCASGRNFRKSLKDISRRFWRKEQEQRQSQFPLSCPSSPRLPDRSPTFPRKEKSQERTIITATTGTVAAQQPHKRDSKA